MKKGFTLVELSIVLVIIGLLIGGILVGQSLMESAKINKVVRQLSQFDVAVSTFMTKYKQLPGDSNITGTWTYGAQGVGNNNKSIDGSGYEVGQAWTHLSIGTGLKNVHGTNYRNFDPFGPPYSAINDYECPRLLGIDQNAAAPTPCLVIYYPSWANGYGFYRYNAMPPSLAQSVYILSPKVVMMLDQKLDDGKTTGNMSAGGGSCFSGTSYLNSDSYTCANVDIRTGIVTGLAK